MSAKGRKRSNTIRSSLCNFAQNNQIMNKYLPLLSFIFLFSFANAQQTISWDFDGVSRQYRQYVPSSYDGSESVPLVIAMHGLGDNINNFSGVGFQVIADTAGFITVYPQALIDGLTQSTAWNSGAGFFGIYPNETIDDVGFINAIIDTVSANYNIDANRIYATGFSMGGFMTNRLACESSDRFAAFASVAGTIGSGITCNPGDEVKICHFHGTADGTVGYGMDAGGAADNNFGMNVTDYLDFWNGNNNCGSPILEGTFPNSANDGRTVEYTEYGSCDNNSRLVHYKALNAEHEWFFQPNNDITYTIEIWKFFLGQSPDNLSLASVTDNQIKSIEVYPNPANDFLNIENLDSKVLTVSVYNTTGQLMVELSGLTNRIDIKNLDTGLYHLLVTTEDGFYSNSFLKQ